MKYENCLILDNFTLETNFSSVEERAHSADTATPIQSVRGSIFANTSQFFLSNTQLFE